MSFRTKNYLIVIALMLAAGEIGFEGGKMRGLNEARELGTPLTIEQVCISLGQTAKRGSNDAITSTFESIGCCYNDGLPEPKGC